MKPNINISKKQPDRMEGHKAPPAKKPVVAKPVAGRAPTQERSPFVMPTTMSRRAGGPMAGMDLPGIVNMPYGNPQVRSGFDRPKVRTVGGKNA